MNFKSARKFSFYLLFPLPFSSFKIKLSPFKLIFCLTFRMFLFLLFLFLFIHSFLLFLLSSFPLPSPPTPLLLPFPSTLSSYPILLPFPLTLSPYPFLPSSLPPFFFRSTALASALFYFQMCHKKKNNKL